MQRKMLTCLSILYENYVLCYCLTIQKIPDDKAKISVTYILPTESASLASIGNLWPEQLGIVCWEKMISMHALIAY